MLDEGAVTVVGQSSRYSPRYRRRAAWRSRILSAGSAAAASSAPRKASTSDQATTGSASRYRSLAKRTAERSPRPVVRVQGGPQPAHRPVEGEVRSLEIDVEPDELEDLVLRHATLAAVVQEREHPLRLAAARLVAAPVLDARPIALHAQRAKGEDADARGHIAALDQGGVECLRAGVDGGTGLREAGELGRLLVLTTPVRTALATYDADSSRRRRSRVSSGAPVAVSPTRVSPTSSPPSMSEMGTTEPGAGGAPSDAIRDPSGADTVSPVTSSTRMTRASAGWMPSLAGLAASSRSPRARRSRSRATAREPPPMTCRGRWAERTVEGGDDDQPQDREEGALKAQHRRAQDLDPEQQDDQGAHDGAAEDRCPEGSCRHRGTEEDAGREDGVRRAHDGERDERGPDPAIRIPDDGEEAQAGAEPGHRDRRQRRPELASRERPGVPRAHGPSSQPAPSAIATSARQPIPEEHRAGNGPREKSGGVGQSTSGSGGWSAGRTR